jgi:hypothetical protein
LTFQPVRAVEGGRSQITASVIVLRVFALAVAEETRVVSRMSGLVLVVDVNPFVGTGAIAGCKIYGKRVRLVPGE